MLQQHREIPKLPASVPSPSLPASNDVIPRDVTTDSDRQPPIPSPLLAEEQDDLAPSILLPNNVRGKRVSKAPRRLIEEI